MPANQSTPEVTRAVPAVEKYGPLSILPVSPTSEQRDLIRASDLYKLGDARLAWVNEGDLSCLLLEQAYIEMAPEWSAIMTAKGYSGTISEALSMLPDRNTRTPARGGDELREATFAGYRLQGPDGEDYFNDTATPLSDNDRRNGWVETPLYALASTDMAGAGEWALIQRLRDEEADSVTILCDNPDGPPNAAVECCGFWTGFDERRFEGDTIVAALQSAVAAKDEAARVGYPRPAAPPVEGLTSGEGWQPIETAPKDGSWFIADGGGLDRPTPMKWCARAGAWECDAVMLEDWDQQAEGYSRPLFWFAIPSRAASPKATATASVREALAKAHLFAVLTLAFFGRDRGTGRQERMLDDIQREAGLIEGILRAALTDSGTAATIGEGDDDRLYLIRKGGLYYRPNAQGYTASTHDAGRYTLAEAIRHSHPNGPDGPRDGMDYIRADVATIGGERA